MAPPLDFHWKRSWRAGPFGWALDVLLVSLTTDVGEISALLASAGHRIVDTTIQRRDRPDSRTFVGRGKLDEVQARVDGGGIDAVVFNGELRPTMHYQLERDLRVECYDRLRALLEVVAPERPRGRESPRRRPNVLHPGDNDSESHGDAEAHLADGHDRLRRRRAVLDGRGVQRHPGGDPPSGLGPPPRGRLRFR